MADFNPHECPVGIANEKAIMYAGERLDMAIERLEEKMEDMKSDLTAQMNSGFSSMNEKLDNVDHRLTALENGIDDKVEKKVKQKHNDIVLSIMGWVFGSLGAAIVISVVTKMITNALHL